MMTAKQGILYEPEVTGVCPGVWSVWTNESERKIGGRREVRNVGRQSVGRKEGQTKSLSHEQTQTQPWVACGSFSSVSDLLQPRTMWCRSSMADYGQGVMLCVACYSDRQAGIQRNSLPEFVLHGGAWPLALLRGYKSGLHFFISLCCSVNFLKYFEIQQIEIFRKLWAELKKEPTNQQGTPGQKW